MKAAVGACPTSWDDGTGSQLLMRASFGAYASAALRRRAWQNHWLLRSSAHRACIQKSVDPGSVYSRGHAGWQDAGSAGLRPGLYCSNSGLGGLNVPRPVPGVHQIR